MGDTFIKILKALDVKQSLVSWEMYSHTNTHHASDYDPQSLLLIS